MPRWGEVKGFILAIQRWQFYSTVPLAFYRKSSDSYTTFVNSNLSWQSAEPRLCDHSKRITRYDVSIDEMRYRNFGEREFFSALLCALLCSNLQYFVVAWLITPVALLSKAHKEFPIALREENSGALVTSDRRDGLYPLYISLPFCVFYSQARLRIQKILNMICCLRSALTGLNGSQNWKCLFLFRSQLHFISKILCNIKEMKYELFSTINRYEECYFNLLQLHFTS